MTVVVLYFSRSNVTAEYLRRTIALNLPTASYEVGDTEEIALDQAKQLALHGYRVIFYTLDPYSIRKSYSGPYRYFRESCRLVPYLYLRELPLPNYKSVGMIGDAESRSFLEAYRYAPVLTEALIKEKMFINVLLSYRPLDGIGANGGIVPRTAVYLTEKFSGTLSTGWTQLADYGVLLSAASPVWNSWWPHAGGHEILELPLSIDAPMLESRPKLSNDVYTIVFAGRLTPQKDCATLIRAISFLIPELKHRVRLLILGEGPLRDDLGYLVEDCGLTDQTQFMGVVDNPQEYFATADLCIFPSLETEGVMRVVIEAMAVAACVISTRGNGNDAILRQGRGELFQAGDVGALSRLIEALLPKLSVRTMIGQAAREFIFQERSPAQSIEKLSAVLF